MSKYGYGLQNNTDTNTIVEEYETTMIDQNLYLTFGTAENISLVALVVSIFFSITSVMINLVLARREKPNIMPTDTTVANGNHIFLNFINTSSYNLHRMTVLVTGFGEDYKKNAALSHELSYLYTIGKGAKFNFGFEVSRSSLGQTFYLRVRFKTKYNSRVPYFIHQHEQIIWYTLIPIGSSGEVVRYKGITSLTDGVKIISKTNCDMFKNDEKNMDDKNSEDTFC